MTVNNRFLPTMVLMLLVLLPLASILVIVHARDVVTLEYDASSLSTARLDGRQQVQSSDSSHGNSHRQNRMTPNSELPSLKAKREQALRNILAARRKQILGQRPEHVRKSSGTSSRDSADVFEAQETRHEVFVERPDLSLVEIETSSESILKTSDQKQASLSSNDQIANADPSWKLVNDRDSSSRPNTEEDESASSSHSRTNYSTLFRNPPSTPTSNLLTSPTKSQKLGETEIRKKNTVSMPDSLYNHFRPVESNIPVEDMSQFLYFGQKIHRESVQNSSSNNSNSLEASTSLPSSSTSLTTRRRYSMKRNGPGTTTSASVPRLEDMMNEEMNIAVERQTVEKNKISKIKNAFRSTGGGLYYRKSTRPSDSTIATNVILTKETGRNSTEIETRNETEPIDDKFGSVGGVAGDDGNEDGGGADGVAGADGGGVNSSAHATKTRERGSTTHVLLPGQTRNATDSTQISYQQRPVSANANDVQAAGSTVKSEIRLADRPTNFRAESEPVVGGTWSTVCVDDDVQTNGSRSEPCDQSSTGLATEEGSRDAKFTTEARSTELELKDTEGEEKSSMNSRASLNLGRSNSDNNNVEFRSRVEEEATTESGRTAICKEVDEAKEIGRQQMEEKVALTGRRKIEEAGPRNEEEKSRETERESSDERPVKEIRKRKMEESLSILTTESSTLRIVVAEENSASGFAIEASTRSERRNTVKPAADSTEERVRGVASGGLGTPPPSFESSSSAPTTTTRTTTPVTNTPDPRPPVVVGPGISASQRQQDHQQQDQHQPSQQQHVYAYTITNVTRLLRNYTGPGLSEDEGGSSKPDRVEKITFEVSQATLSLSRNSSLDSTLPSTSTSPESPLSPSSSPDSSSAFSSSNARLLPPRTGSSSIGAAQAPVEVSAGATVEPVTSAGVSPIVSLVGERHRKPVIAGQSQQRGHGRTTSHHGTAAAANVNKGSTTGRSPRPAEVTTRGTVRWNETVFRNSDLEAFTDRRFLRKSASAVLNQRIASVSGVGGVVEETLWKKRRVHVGGGVNLRNGSVRTGKGSTVYLEAREKDEKEVSKKVEEEPTVNAYQRLAGMNGSTVNGTDATSISPATGNHEDESGEGSVDEEITPRLAGVNNKVEGEVLGNSTFATPAPAIVATTIASDRTRPRDMFLGGSKLNANRAIKDEKEEPHSTSVPEEEDGASLATSVDAEHPTDPTTILSTITEANRETTEDITRSPLEAGAVPVFPVTPKILTTLPRANAVLASNETFTLGSAESVNQVTSSKTPEADRPFGIDADLDPSEIQKMYRSNATTSSGTTALPPDANENSSTRAADGNSSARAADENSSMRPANGRSPEVRARNLSDETKGDDVLPIMHLYNTSDIFNGTNGSRELLARRGKPTILTEGSRVEAPFLNTTNVEASKTTKSSKASAAGGARVPGVDSRVSSTPLSNVTRKEETVTAVPVNSTVRGTSLSSTNRTRNRPAYHHSILPEYNDSVFPTEIDRTFLETGLISIGPRDSVNVSEVISKRHDGDAIASQETVAVVSYILATLVVFPIAVGVGLILRRLIIRNRKVLEESDTSSEISCRKDALNLENGDFKTSIEKAITKLPRIQHLCHEAEKPPPPASQESRWEFPRDQLRLQTVLGQGNFGQVWKAEADDLTGHQGTTRLVAVKTVKEGASEREKEDLVRELEIMQQLGSHPNVVTLLGCCTEEEPHYLILEYVMYGKLLAYLRDHRTRQDFYNFSEDSAALTSRDLTVFGYCVARGMEYLASKKIIHRDLAARNVLVDHNKLCKIADFGMSRFANKDGEVIETRHGRNALPIRWMAPESLIYSLFTTKTDVWSFGILMWEIVTLGSTPYPDMTAREVMRNVQSCYRLERPSHCRSELFRVISRCWHADPDRRPEFQTLRRDLAQLLEDNMNGHYVDLESFASECID